MVVTVLQGIWEEGMFWIFFTTVTGFAFPPDVKLLLSHFVLNLELELISK